MSATRMSPFQILPRATHIQGINLARLLNRNDAGFPCLLSFLYILGRQVSLYLLNPQQNSRDPGLLLSWRVSSYIHPQMHLFTVLENSTLRRDCDFLRQVSLCLTNLFDRVLWVSPGFSVQSDCSQSKNLPRQWKPGSSSSALTLKRSCCLLPILASFSPSFWCSWSSWNSERSRESWDGWCYYTDKEDSSIRHVWNYLCSTRLRVNVWCQCIDFEFWDPDYLCQTINQEQLCGFWKHVSLLDFSLWWTF